MKVITAVLTSIGLVASVATEAQTLNITRGGSRPVRQGPAENFTGAARVEMLFETLDPLHASAGSVTFEPGARTAWHSHPAGQILIVTAGTGRVQRWGDRIEEIRTGDVVRIPADQKHWHGAAPHASMTHIAITEPRDGMSVQWMEKVTDDQYNSAPPGPAPQPSQPPSGRQAKRLESSGTSRSTAAGRARSRHSRSTIRCSPPATSTQQHCASGARVFPRPPLTQSG